jgi:endo-1,4-beta-mannosidase
MTSSRDAFAGRFLLGANYWPRAAGPRMWQRFDAAAVAAELAHMRAVGIDACRAFAFVPSFMPRPPAIDEDKLRHFAALVEAAERAGVGLLPTALVGHMSGENFDFAGQGGRSLYRDPELLDWQRRLVASLARAAGASPAVLGWVLSNEMPLWGGAAPADDIVAWARAIIGALREIDPARPIGVGDGAMAGWPTQALAPLVDWLGPHVYYADADPLRQAYHTDFALRALLPLGRPVLLEEIGCSSTQAGEAEQAAYLREALHVALGCGARGLVAWCWSDFDAATLGDETPYSHHGFELGFGLVRADGSEKPACGEFRALRALLDRVGSEREMSAPRPRTALVRPAILDEDVPFSWQDRTALRRTLLQAFVLACQAGLDPDVVGEEHPLDGYALVLAPATQKLRTPTWRRLAAAADAGATVYWSYFSGDHDFHQGMWCPIFEPLTGLRHRLRYGCCDAPPDRLRLKGDVALDVPTGIAHAANPWPLARLPVDLSPGLDRARTLAVDGDGRPALTELARGRGRVVFLAYPLERYLANLVDGSSREAHRLYRLLGELAGVGPKYPTRQVNVQSRVLETGRDDLVVVQHRGWQDAVDDATDVPRGAEVVSDASGRSDGALGPKGVRVYRVPDVR